MFTDTKQLYQNSTNYILVLLENSTIKEELKQLNRRVSQKGHKKIAEFSMNGQELIQAEFKLLLQRVIVEAKRKQAYILISHFKPFEKDNSIPAMELLLNSNIKFEIDDYLDLNITGFRAIMEAYKRRKKSGRRESDSKARIENASSTLNTPAQKSKTQRKKLLYLYKDINNQEAMKELMLLLNNHPNEKISYTAQANHLTEKKITTPRGKNHNQKSVSRLHNKIESLASRLNYPDYLDYLKRFNPSVSQLRQINAPLNINNPGNSVIQKNENSSTVLKGKKRFSFDFINENTGDLQTPPYAANERIIIHFGDEWEKDININIKISSSIAGEEEFNFNINEPLPKQFEISLTDKDFHLLPGVHLFELKVEGFEPNRRLLSLMDFINNPIQYQQSQ